MCPLAETTKALRIKNLNSARTLMQTQRRTAGTQRSQKGQATADDEQPH
jgi:hypothetical protein